MFWKVIILSFALYKLREAMIDRMFKPLYICEDTLHYLYRYCAISQSHPDFLDYYRAKEEIERREEAIKSVKESKFFNLGMKILLPSERKYFNDFGNVIPDLKVQMETSDAEYKRVLEDRRRRAIGQS